MKESAHLSMHPSFYIPFTVWVNYSRSSLPKPLIIYGYSLILGDFIDSEAVQTAFGFGRAFMNETRLRIVTVADTRFAQTLLNLFVEAHSNMVLVGAAHDGTEAVQMAAQRQPDLL